MTENSKASQAIVKPVKGISWIWLLPTIAAIFGAVMFFQAWSNRGVEIVIQFDDAEGLEVKQTLVKYRNVDIGRVERLRFADDGESVLCYINIKRDMQRFLKIDSQFWVVRPRIGASGVSGIGTLLSGAFINLEPGEEDTVSDSFVGLNAPPIASPTEAGIKLQLISSGGKTLSEGDPVTYRGIDVGVVESENFDVIDRSIEYGIFIRAPYDQLITSNTFFWNASGVSVSTSVNGIQVDLASIETLIAGGVAFDVPEDLPIGERVRSTQSFKLYDSKFATYDERQYEYLEYAILVEETVGGLVAGAPVEYRGIQIGRVEKPYLGFYETNTIRQNEERIPVIIHIEPKRLAQDAEYDLEWFKSQFETWLKSGLEARIDTANYLTGSLKVSLDLSGPALSDIESFGEYQVIPIAQGGFASLLSKTDELLNKLNNLPIEDLLAKINNLPVEELLENTNQTVITANTAMQDVQLLINAMQSTLNEVNTAIQTIQPNSEIHDRLISNLDQIERTLLTIQPVINDLKQKPNSLVFSEAAPNDKAPRKKQ